MSVKKRRWKTVDGVEHVAFRVRYRMNGVEFCKQFASKIEAERFQAMTTIQMQDGLHTPDSKSLSFDKVAQYYLEHMSTRVEESTYATYCREIATAITYIGRMRMCEFNPQVSNRYLDRLMAIDDCTESHRFKAWISFKKVMKFAYTRGYIHSDVCSMIHYPNGKRDEAKRSTHIPDVEEVQSFMSKMLGFENKVMILVLTLTGVRIGEAQGLKWIDIDFDEQTLRVQRAIDRQGKITLPKTRAGTRTIPLTTSLVKALRTWRLQSIMCGPQDFVFVGRKGKPVNYITIIDRWNRTWSKMPAGVERFRIHELRHHFASRLIEKKFSDLQIMTWMGHQDLTTTYKVYGHLLGEAIPRAQVDELSSSLSI